MDEHSESHDSERLTMASTESRLSHIEAALARQEQMSEAVSSQLLTLAKKVDQIVDKRSEKPWGILSGWAAILLAIGGMAFAPMYKEIEKSQESITRITQSLSNHFLQEGHVGMSIRVDSLEDELEKLDIILQREMRLLDETTDSNLSALDKMLQREMDLKRDNLRSDLTSVHKEIEKLRDWQEIRQEGSIKSNTEQEERIKALERIAFGDKE